MKLKYPWSQFPGLKTAFIIAEIEAQKKMGVANPKVEEAIEVKAEIMAEAVKGWILEQELTITEMKASLEVEEINTSDSIDADIKPTRDLSMLMINLMLMKEIIGLVVAPIKKLGDWEVPSEVPALGGLKPLAFVAATVIIVETWFKTMGKTMTAKIPPGNGADQITVKPVAYSKEGGQGGRMTSSGHAYIGPEANIVPGSDLTTNGNGITKVQLLEENIKDGSMD